jgi:hypothetical protein
MQNTGHVTSQPVLLSLAYIFCQLAWLLAASGA